ncbi:MAG: DegV family protein [Clostridia bacterium]|nr:DegV family protein [Clostridia bacterium]
MSIAITADSVIDLTPELLEKFNIKLIPISVIVGDDVYDDGVITTDEIFAYVKKTGVLPKTSACNETRYSENFSNLLKEYDGVIHFSLSSFMSASHMNAVNASKQFDGKVEVIDSMSLSTGTGIQAIYARELTKTESDIHVIAEKVRSRVSSVQASFVVERLDFLHKGGRCSSVALLGANLLKIRPQIIVKDGKMGSHKKYRGAMPLVVKKYCYDVLEEFNTPDKKICFITYSSATPEMIESAKQVVSEAGFETVYITRAGGTISSHCGENTLGILYYNDGK